MSTPTVSVAGRLIGDGHPTFVIAEAACSHMCEMDAARALIDRAAEAGADAVKFQTYKAERLARKDAKLYWSGGETSQVEYFKRLDRFGPDEYRDLFAHAQSRGIIGFSTPFDVDSASMLEELGVPLFKIASCDLPDVRLLRHVARFGKPIVLSTGASTSDEIDRAVQTIQDAGNTSIMLLACMLSYPTNDADANLLRIPSLRQRYPHVVIGLSDHTRPDPNMVIPSLAVAAGARVIEKHYILDRAKVASGQAFGVEPAELAKMVQNIRVADTVLGDGSLGVHKAEEAARNNARRSLVAERPIRRGEVIESAMIGLKRPGDGMPGWMFDDVVGRRARVDIDADQPLAMNMLE